MLSPDEIGADAGGAPAVPGDRISPRPPREFLISRSDRARLLGDIDEATVALACASPELGHSTQAKREIGKLWEDTAKAPYKALFNPSISGLKMWHCISIMRHIDRALQEKLKAVSGRDSGFLIHGNRYIGHMVFQRLPVSMVNGSSPLPGNVEAAVRMHVDEIYEDLTTQANALYPQAYLAQLFKNQKKLTEITEAIADARQSSCEQNPLDVGSSVTAV